MKKTRRSGVSCCVPGCCFEGDLSTLKFYSFPKRNHLFEKRAKWIKAVSRINADGSLWQPNSRSFICNQHFVGGLKSEHPQSPSYLPTIFPEKYYGKPSTSKIVQLKAQNRFMRAIKRRLTLSSSEVEHMPTNTEDDLPKVEMQEDTKDIIQSMEPRFSDVATQIDFYEGEIKSTQINMFCLIRVKEVTCEVQTQANITFKKSDKIIIASKKTSDVGCGTFIQYADKQVGPNPISDKDLLTCKGFHGFSSIKQEQELIDLAGVSFSRFQSLLKEAENIYKGSISKNDVLLIFLMRMKSGLPYSFIGVLFGINRITVSRIVHKYKMHLANSSCKNLIPRPSKFINEELPENSKE